MSQTVARPGAAPPAFAYEGRSESSRTAGPAVPSASGLIFAGVVFAASVVPSLLPRSWLVQGVLSGIAMSVGYGLGVAAGAVGSILPARRHAASWLPIVKAVAVAASFGLALWALTVNQLWQSDVRQMMGLDAAGWYYPAALATTALLTAGTAILLGRLVRAGHRLYVRGVNRVVAPRWRRTVRVAVAILLVGLTADVLMADWMVGAARDAFASADARYDVDVEQPVSELRSGGPGSYVAWETLGRMGRAFTGSGPTTGELTSFNGLPATPPIRVYVGLAAAGSAEARAALAVAELERTRAFDRQVLLLATPTGTGWVDPAAVDPLEYLYNGDTAAVAVQYSYQPSWATMLGNQDRAKEGAAALMDAVTRRLEQMPADRRPRLLLYGQSLGSFGSEQLFSSVEDVIDTVDGVLWAGPPRANPLWRNLVTERDSDSPVWAPVYDGGRTVRFGTDGAALSAPSGPWHPPRIAYLQNATDPVTWWSSPLFWERPEWMNGQRGPGVSQHMPFVPVVTCVQIALDLLQSTGVPPGYGHVFGPAHAEAWALIAPPPDWSSGDTTKLLSVLARAEDAHDETN